MIIMISYKPFIKAIQLIHSHSWDSQDQINEVRSGVVMVVVWGESNMQHSLDSDDRDVPVAPVPCRLVSTHSAPTSIPLWSSPVTAAVAATSSRNTAQPNDDTFTPNHTIPNYSSGKERREGEQDIQLTAKPKSIKGKE